MEFKKGLLYSIEEFSLPWSYLASWFSSMAYCKVLGKYILTIDK